MPHSPYQTTVHAAIDNLESYRSALNRIQTSMDDDETDKFRDQELMGLAEPLLDQCDFLEAKLGIKKRKYAELEKNQIRLNDTFTALKTENQGLKDEVAALKAENQALKDEAAAGAAAASKTEANGKAAENGEDTPKEAGPSGNARKRRAADSDTVAEGGEEAAKKAKGG
ncbi:MAG: hypothetical protein Q9173_002325 [Seirophora scorigena]